MDPSVTASDPPKPLAVEPPPGRSLHGNLGVPLERWGLAGLRDEVLDEATGINEPVARVAHVASLGGRIAPHLGLAATPRCERLAWTSGARTAVQVGRPK